jgi:DNA polymerase-1
MKKLIVIDLSNFIFRAFFAIRPLTTPSGTPVNAVYGVLSMFYNMLQKYQPTHILMARDTKEGSFRKEIDPNYKAHRTEPPDDLKPQFEIIDQLIDVLKIPQMKLAGFEADDIIGSAVTQWKSEFDEILIASGDKDLMQFVDEKVQILDTMKDKIYFREDVKDKMGVYPEEIVDYLSLIGDSSDNIPGVPGIGPKGAQGLIEQFGTLDEILKNKDLIKNKRVYTALQENSESAILSKKLVQIITNLDLHVSPQACSYQLIFDEQGEVFLDHLGFRSWLSKLSPFKKQSTAHVKNTPVVDVKVEKVSASDLNHLFKEIDTLMVTGLQHDKNDQFDQWSGIVISISDKSVHISFDSESKLEVLRFINRPEVLVVSYQIKPLLLFCLINGTNPKFKYFDISQAHFLLNPEFRHDQETVIEEYLKRKIKIPTNTQRDLFGDVTSDELSAISQINIANFELFEILRGKLKEFDVERPYFDLDLPLIKILAQMEIEGVRLDVDFYKLLEKEFSDELFKIEAEVLKFSGEKINLRSPKQVGEFLFEKLNLPIIKKTKTGYSTDAEVLQELASMNLHPVPELLLKSRELEKLLSTYVRSLPQMIQHNTKKIHTHFQPSNAATGRLSSDHPNLQNIPIRTENGRKLRKGFIASTGRILLAADYSQVELRLLAHFSQDPSMLEAFKKNLDIHKQTAAEIFGIPLDQVTKDQRNGAKAINFGLMYGQTSFGLSQALRISQAEAKKYITNYFHKFHAVKSFLDKLKERAEETGYAETLFGRKRSLPDIKSTNRQVKSMAERMAINSPIQGTAADIIKLAMINIQKELEIRNYKSKMILQVHDELIFDVLPEELDLMKKLVREKMENAVNLSVPLLVEMGSGQNWYDLK